MNDIDDLELKAEIDRISDKIEDIIENVKRLDPALKEDGTPEQE